VRRGGRGPMAGAMAFEEEEGDSSLDGGVVLMMVQAVWDLGCAGPASMLHKYWRR
jgi:hypothetical protein